MRRFILHLHDSTGATLGGELERAEHSPARPLTDVGISMHYARKKKRKKKCSCLKCVAKSRSDGT